MGGCGGGAVVEVILKESTRTLFAFTMSWNSLVKLAIRASNASMVTHSFGCEDVGGIVTNGNMNI